MKIGRVTKINLEANEKLKQIYIEKGIQYCELRFEGCWKNVTLGFAHREKRWKYIKTPEKLSEFTETLLACTSCHNKIENDRLLSEKKFRELRGK